MHCGRFQATPLSRREMLARCANGFGSIALAGLMADELAAADSSAQRVPLSSLAPRPTHFAPRAKNVIFLFMDGGPSQVDTFDPKPLLAKEHGQPIKMKVPPTQFDNVGKVFHGPWKFKQYGESGTPVSDLFPHIAECVDDMAVVRSMVANFSEHTNANYFIHSGSGIQGRPSMGAWVTYGLGSECQNLPGFVVLSSGMIPPGGMDCFTSSFLPATYQGSIFKQGQLPIADVTRLEKTESLQRRKLELMRQLDRRLTERQGAEDQLESSIANYELAFKMQSAVPDLMDLSGETKETHALYGLDAKFPHTQTFARQCLIARRLIERGVRFIELLCPNCGHDRWDQHRNLIKGHEDNALAVDQPIAALMKDLKNRGLLDETLIVWGGEFGRTPMAQGTDGRDHNPFGFSMWLAGGGIKGGTVYGSTDEYGYYAIENKVEIHDLHATMLHLLGVDHKRLTVRFGGRDVRLTDVHGEVVKGILA
ncbi:MAG: DUF1501 domain-containing protein [Planctomycetaceae bacterium]|nr:DUF1501 domain-containing protein [Planctomycetaceae bacterium]